MASTLCCIITVTLVSLVVPSYSRREYVPPPLPPPTTPPVKRCPLGSAVMDGTGKRIICSPRQVPTNCPRGTTCVGGLADQDGSCCRDTNICKTGKPFVTNGDAPPCRGPNAIRCPAAFTCEGDTNPLSSVCCPVSTGATCPVGNPLPGIFCGRGPNRQDCPSGYFCNIDPTDRFAVCCKETPPTFPPPVQFKMCPLGSVVDRPGGIRLNCTAFRPVPSPPQCPKGSQCIGGPADEPGSCCLKDNLCKFGKPLASNGDAVPCQGPNGIRCPAAYQCQISSKPQSSVCCLREPPFVPKCKYGKYFKDLGQKPTCNPLASQACPSGYSCSKTPNNKPGFCCRETNPCKRGVPLHKDGDAVNCIGPGKIDCPTGYKCVGSADTSSVCCRERKYPPYHGGPSSCPHNKPKQNCHIDLCKVRFCPRMPSARCRMDFCGKCTDRWYVGRTEVTKRCKEGAPASQCPKDKPFNTCFIPPCPGPNEPTKCPNFPKAQCYPYQCGGVCQARYFLNQVEKTANCRKYGR